ncbi:MAG TPA: histone H1 [bacterium]|nr:histone H1 [bacterium]
MATSWEGLKGIVAAGEDDYGKFMRGNNAAGTRVRKTLMEIKKYADQMRKEVQEQKDRRKEEK